MLDCLHPEAGVQPLSFGANVVRFHGHDGLRRWLAGFEGQYDHYRIDLDFVQQIRGERFVASGSLRHHGYGRLAPFCGLYRFADGRILDARHYLTEPEVLVTLID